MSFLLSGGLRDGGGNAIPDSVISQNLNAWYRFEDADARDYASSAEFPNVSWGDSTAYDGTPDGNSGTPTHQSSGGVTDTIDGANSGAFDFVKSNTQYIDSVYSVESNLSGGAITVMAWVYADSLTTNNYYVNSIYFDSNSQSDGQIYLNIDGVDNCVGMAYWDGSGDWQGTADNTFSTGQWHHVAGRYDGSTIQPFIDGSASTGDSETGQSGWNDHGPFIGAGFEASSGNSNYSFDGRIDDVRIYNTDLSNSQINSIYNATKP